MKIRILTIGTRMPDWVERGTAEYLKRMPRECPVELIEIKQRDDADAQMLQRIQPHECVIALDERGKPWNTLQLSKQLQGWRDDDLDVVLLIGGPNGLSDECLARAKTHWSLSNLTLPHPLVRVLLTEQLYRAWTVTQGHPYHIGH